MKASRLLVCLLCLTLLFTGLAGAESSVPEFHFNRKDIPDNEGMAMLRSIGVGWNMGNTFDANDCFWLKDEMAYESAWCGAMTTPEVFRTLAASGFKTVRIPVSWHNHINEDRVISKPWMDRVHEVVGWALDSGLYVILNIHHDFSKPGSAAVWLCPNQDNYAASAAYMEAIWGQICERFADYGDHLIFESMNEPRLVDDPHEWWIDPQDPTCVEAIACVNGLNQVFVDTVRAHPAHADRWLMVPGYDASPDGVLNDGFAIPDDPAGRVMLSVHAYTPYSFALEYPGTDFFASNVPSSTQDIISFMDRLYDKYISKGVPVVIGEFGARDKNGNLANRVDYAAYYTAFAASRGLPVLWWDNNSFKGSGENFGVMDRATASWAQPDIVQALILNAYK